MTRSWAARVASGVAGTCGASSAQVWVEAATSLTGPRAKWAAPGTRMAAAQGPGASSANRYSAWLAAGHSWRPRSRARRARSRRSTTPSQSPSEQRWSMRTSRPSRSSASISSAVESGRRGSGSLIGGPSSVVAMTGLPAGEPPMSASPLRGPRRPVLTIRSPPARSYERPRVARAAAVVREHRAGHQVGRPALQRDHLVVVEEGGDGQRDRASAGRATSSISSRAPAGRRSPRSRCAAWARRGGRGRGRWPRCGRPRPSRQWPLLRSPLLTTRSKAHDGLAAAWWCSGRSRSVK